MNQIEMAELLGITQANVSRIEASGKGPSASFMLPIANVLQCDVRDLLGVERDGTDSSSGVDAVSGEFLAKALEANPQLSVCLSSFIRNEEDISPSDWRMIADSMKLSLEFAASVIELKQMRGRAAEHDAHGTGQRHPREEERQDGDI